MFWAEESKKKPHSPKAEGEEEKLGMFWAERSKMKFQCPKTRVNP